MVFECLSIVRLLEVIIDGITVRIFIRRKQKQYTLK